ncbi:MAG: peroxidase-related enzyme [Bacteroidota bacterium]
MSWIEEIPYESAEGSLKKLYDRVKDPDNNIDNVLTVHSLRPHSMLGHMTLYKNVLHNKNNSLSKWYLEALGVYTSYLNKCDYCVCHHYEGMKRLINDKSRSQEIMHAIEKDQMEKAFSGKELAGVEYARMLTLAHYEIKEDNIEQLRKQGFSDGEILEINQVVSYFNYVNRMVVGLGVSIEGEIIRFSPTDNEDPDNRGYN